MTERSTGLILRLRPLTETSLIVHWLTPDFGRMVTVAKGARRPKSPFRGKLDLLYVVDFSFVRSRRTDLHSLSEISVRETNEALRHELAYLQQAAYCATLIEQTTETETPIGGYFQLMLDLVHALPTHPPQPLTVFAFEVKLLRESGLEPDFPETGLSAGAKQILIKALELDWPTLLRMKLTKPQIVEIRQFLHGFLIYHLGKIPRGRSAAVEDHSAAS